METFECIEKRRTIRRFLDSPVEWEKIGNLLRAAQLAPSSGNVQDYKFLVVTDKTKRAALANACLKQSWIAKAPVIIIVYSEPKQTKRFYGLRGEKLYTIQNSAASIENMLLAAVDQDLGAAWVGAFDENMINSAVGAPQTARPQAVIPVGYTDEEPALPKKYNLVDVTFINSWGGKIVNPDIGGDDFSEVIRKKIIEAKEALEEHAPVLGQTLADKAKSHFKKIKDNWDKKNESSKKKEAKELSKEIGGDEDEILEDSEEFE